MGKLSGVKSLLFSMIHAHTSIGELELGNLPQPIYPSPKPEFTNRLPLTDQFEMPITIALNQTDRSSCHITVEDRDDDRVHNAFSPQFLLTEIPNGG